MYSKLFFAAALACVFDASVATFILGTAAGTTGAVTIGSGGAALGLLGLLAIKGIAIGALALASSRRRGRRSADEDEAQFAVIAASEPEQCYRRLICDLATGNFANSENNVIVSLFDKEVGIESQKYEFFTAAKLGKLVKDVKTCELRYSCQLTGAQLDKLF